ncbi:RNA-binding protein [Trypanosoma cruzi]|uniref:RNA-binding protein n=2 Tax=Trypanosoma cruzi TaxID=5693 RepID=V5BKI0_TRYCR|nr:RNA-binding protein [Trypanosoma cruzi Dm28c]KAF8290051.1 putative RNA-binding protein [Trypanosoma cruzi]PWU90203.1 putative RNA-binding protein [Trypanosoma cruzi]RNF19674.1 RNA-binding protein [Trypanosoma cruzi]
MPSGGDPRNLIVNYIPTPVSDESLREMFEKFGTLVSARVIRDKKRDGHPKGYGFVVYAERESGLRAMEEMNGFKIHNKHLRVSPAFGPGNAQPKSETGDAVMMQANKTGEHWPSLPSAQLCAPLPYSVDCTDVDPRNEPGAMPFQSVPPVSLSQAVCTTPVAMQPPTVTILNAVPVQFYAASHFVLAPTSNKPQMVATAVHPQGSITSPHSPPATPSPPVIVFPNASVGNNRNHAHINSAVMKKSSSNISLIHNAESGIVGVPSQLAPTIQNESSYQTLIRPVSFPPSIPIFQQSEPMVQGCNSSFHSSMGSLDVVSITAGSKPLEGLNGILVESPIMSR